MQTIRIFISSPGDVKEERDNAKTVISELQSRYDGQATLIPVLWEDLAIPATASFQEGIDCVLAEGCRIDIAVFILWTRLGSPLGSITKPDGTPYLSGTEREFDLMLAAFKQSNGKSPLTLAYTRKDDDGFGKFLEAHKHDDDALEEILKQRRLAKKFIEQNFKDEEGRNSRAYHSYKHPAQFADRLKSHLRGAIDELVQPYDVFISHSKADKNIADSLCAILEQQHLKCWIAPRNITPGTSWGESIIDAISQCRSMIVIFSKSSNESAYVVREVERAVNRGIPIIPIRIEDVLPSKKLELYLSVPHWLDALTSPVEKHFLQVSETLRAILSVSKVTSIENSTKERVSPDGPTLGKMGQRIGSHIGGLFHGFKQGIDTVKPPQKSINPKSKAEDKCSETTDKNPHSESTFQTISAEGLKRILTAKESASNLWAKVSLFRASPGLEEALTAASSINHQMEHAFLSEDYPLVLKNSEILKSIVDEILQIKNNRDAAESQRDMFIALQTDAQNNGAERFAASLWKAADCFSRNAYTAYNESNFILATDHWSAACEELRSFKRSTSSPANKAFYATIENIEKLKMVATRIGADRFAKPHLAEFSTLQDSGTKLFHESHIEESREAFKNAEKLLLKSILTSSAKRRKELEDFVLNIADLLRNSADVNSDEARNKAEDIARLAFLAPEDTPELINQAWSLLKDAAINPLPTSLFLAVVGTSGEILNTHQQVPKSEIRTNLKPLLFLSLIFSLVSFLFVLGGNIGMLIFFAFGIGVSLAVISANRNGKIGLKQFRNLLKAAASYFETNPEVRTVTKEELVTRGYLAASDFQSQGIMCGEVVLDMQGGTHNFYALPGMLPKNWSISYESPGA